MTLGPSQSSKHLSSRWTTSPGLAGSPPPPRAQWTPCYWSRKPRAGTVCRAQNPGMGVQGRGEGSKCPCSLLPSLPCTLDPEQIPGALGASSLICLMGEMLLGPPNSRAGQGNAEISPGETAGPSCPGPDASLGGSWAPLGRFSWEGTVKDHRPTLSPPLRERR